MARSATIYRVQLQLSHVDRDVYADRQLTVARHPSETLERALVRILAYALRYDDQLEFGRGISTSDEPDLWRREGDGRVTDWIEVGQPDSKRLIKASRKATRCDLFVFADRDQRWRKSQLDAMKAPDNLSVAYIDDGFLASLAEGVDRKIHWSITVADGTLYLTSGDASFETTPEIWLGQPLS
jgi:uncharacterized protein YaeQ